MAKVQQRFVGIPQETGPVAFVNCLNIWVLAQRATALFAIKKPQVCGQGTKSIVNYLAKKEKQKILLATTTLFQQKQ